MTVDLAAIAQRGRCEESNLRLALPLLEQGYLPPFLARYRRDELGGLDEAVLWTLAEALKSETALANRRAELLADWQATPLADPALGRAIEKAGSKRMLQRLARRIKLESNEAVDGGAMLALRVLNPQKQDTDDFQALAESVEGIDNHEDAIGKLEESLARRLAGDPRMINSAVQWLSKHARIHIAEISDPHVSGAAETDAGDASDDDESDDSSQDTASQYPTAKPMGEKQQPQQTKAASESKPPAEPGGEVDTTATDEVKAESVVASTVETPTAENSTAENPTAENPTAENPAAENPAAETPTAETPAAENPAAENPAAENPTAENPTAENPTAETPTAETPAAENPAAETPAAETPAAETPTAETPTAETPAAETPAAETPAAETPTGENPAAENPTVETPAEVVPTAEGPVAESSATDVADAASVAPPTADEAEPMVVGFEPADSDSEKPKKKKKKKSKTKVKELAAKKQKKISPRQRRRRWLMSVLKPLEGKQINANKLSSFQTVMLARALRSQVAQCSFQYDANKLVAELQRTAARINSKLADTLEHIVIENEADIRAAAEAAWWDELQERASGRLLGIAADHLRSQVNRGGVEAQVVLSIDAVGPRTAAASIVAADGRLLHYEDLPCQLSAPSRSQAVLRMGELIHTHHVDLIVVSNGPARRGCLVAVSELIKQSPENSIRWTLADRSGADTYAGSAIADQEMRSTPRRFRAASWIAFSVIQPAQAIAKVDPLKLRLGSFQRELSDSALLEVLDDVVVSGASRGGVDVNSAPTSWLSRLPGVSEPVASLIDSTRRKSLFQSRQALAQLEGWDDATAIRQAMPFLRVFGSDESLDSTLIHPDDYPLAKKLANALELQMPPATPPGYQPPDFSDEGVAQAKKQVDLSSEPKPEIRVVEDFSASKPAVESEEETPFGEVKDNDANDETKETADSPKADSPEAAAEPEVNQTQSESATPADASAVEPADAPTAEQTDAPAAEQTAAPLDNTFRQVKPEKAKVDKCVKEWQIGYRKAYQIVRWLCDPYGDGDFNDSDSHGVLTSVPALKALKPGDQVIGVAVGVMPFGVFVELAPDCSGLIHVSKVSDRFVEDLHEAIQVGDVVTTWVTGIDEKRRRVALSAISPEREAELEELRQQQSPRGRSNRGGSPPRGIPQSPSTGPARTSQARTGSTGGGSGSGGGGGRATQSQGASQGARSGPAQGGGFAKAGARGGSDRGRGGRDSRGGGGGRDSRPNRGQRQPESYRVASSKAVEPISDAMKQGEEPLRSFGDLMQFFKKPEPVKPEPVKPEPVKPEPVSTEPVKPEPVKPEPVSTEPVSTEPVSTELVIEASQPDVEPTPVPSQATETPQASDSVNESSETQSPPNDTSA